MASGDVLGARCVIDAEARQFDPQQIETLQFLAAQVVQKLEQRRPALLAPSGSLA